MRRVKFILQFFVKVIDVCCCFYFIFTFSFYRVTNKFVCISCRAAEVARAFYNDLCDKPFLIMNLVLKKKMKEIFLVLLQTLMLMSLIKILIVLHKQLMKKTWYQGNKSLKALILSLTKKVTIFYHPKYLLPFIILTQKDNL